MQETYYVRAVWDDEAKVFISDTNVPGLNVEAATLHEFMEIVEELAPEMLAANVSGPRDDGSTWAAQSAELKYACA